MDEAQRAYYSVCFRCAFLEKKGAEFERWFIRLASHAYGSDFESVQAAGPDGDFKADGRRVSTGTIYQCYAPQRFQISTLEKKISADFDGAKKHWAGIIREWILVVNTNDGLPARCVRSLDELRNANPDIKIRVWMEAQLRELMQCLSLDQCEDLFGFSPSVSGINTLALSDIVPIIDELAQEEPEIGVEPITPPSVEKLQRNALSDDATELLKLGRRKEYIVSRYFSSTIQTEKGERIAESFRRRYADLKAQDHAPDIIFGQLQQYAGSTSEPKRQSIGLAILSYFFERCDIFEDPSDSVVQ